MAQQRGRHAPGGAVEQLQAGNIRPDSVPETDAHRRQALPSPAWPRPDSAERTTSAASPAEAAPERSIRLAARAHWVMWTCSSHSPGMTYRPSRSTTCDPELPWRPRGSEPRNHTAGHVHVVQRRPAGDPHGGEHDVIRGIGKCHRHKEQARCLKRAAPIRTRRSANPDREAAGAGATRWTRDFRPLHRKHAPTKLDFGAVPARPLGDEPPVTTVVRSRSNLGEGKGILRWPASAGTGQKTAANMTVNSDIHTFQAARGQHGSSDAP